MTAERARYDLGLIIPTVEEFEYMRRSMPFRPISGDGSYWFEFSIPGQRWGVVHVLFDMGLVATATAATKLLSTFSPEVLAVVGIGGALSTDLALGDVVVGSAIQEYMKAAKVASDPGSHPVIQPAGDSWPLAERLRRYTNHFRYFAEDHYQAWIRHARIRAAEGDLSLTTTPGARRQPDYSLGPIASGDFVVADPAFKKWLTSYDRMRSVVEMEAAGAARAVRDHDKDVALLVLRGISDFADSRKTALDAGAFGGASSDWRRYATQNAFELLLTFLASPGFPWRESAVSRRPDGEPSLGVDDKTDATESAFRRAWDHFIRVAPVVSAAASLTRVRPNTHGPGQHHETTSSLFGHHDLLHLGGHHGDHDQHHGADHGDHGDHGDTLEGEDSDRGPEESWYAGNTWHLPGGDHSYHPDTSHSGPDHSDGYQHGTGSHH